MVGVMVRVTKLIGSDCSQGKYRVILIVRYNIRVWDGRSSTLKTY